MMRLASYPATVPVFTVRSKVSHLTPRLPTAFEKAILRLIERAAAFPAIGESSLRAAFEDMLGVTGARPLIEASMRELQSLDVLVSSDVDEPLEAPLASWRLTEQGVAFWRRGLLPRRPELEQVEHGFDPVTNTLGPVPRSQASQSAASLTGEAPVMDLGPLVQAALERARPAWFRATTEITDIACEIMDVRWRTVQLQLDLAADGGLRLAAPGDQAFDRWLRAAQPELVWELLIAPVLQVRQAEHGGPMVDLSGVAGVSALAPATSSNGGLIAVNGVRNLRRAAGDQLHLSEDCALPGQTLSADGASGIAVLLPVPPGLHPGFQQLALDRPGGTVELQVAGIAKLVWAGQARSVHLHATLAERDAGAAWALLSAQVEHWLSDAAALPELALAAWFEAPEAAVERWVQRAAELDPLAWFEALPLYAQALRDRLGSLRSVEALLAMPARETLDRLDAEIALATGLRVLEALTHPALGGLGLTRAVLARMLPVATLEEARQVRHALREDRTVLPASLLGKAVRRQLLLDALAGREAACGPHDLLLEISNFRVLERQARHGIPAVLLEQDENASPEWRRALRTRAARTLEQVAKLLSAMDKVCSDLELPREALTLRYARLHALQRAIQSALAAPLPDAQRAVVIDTNVLLDQPDLFERMPQGDRAVLARSVIDELDRLKSPRSESPDDEARAHRARAASRALEANQARLQLEPSRREQCAADLAPTADHEILALAVYYSLGPVLLLSGDRNLRLKARDEGVPVQTPGEYLKPARPALERSPAA